MNRDDIIKMAREANFGFMTEKPKSATHMQCGIDDLERFFHMAQAAEREKVAKWQIGSGYSTGHGETIEDLLVELEWQVRESEREAISDEWWICVQSDLENGVKSLNEVATKKWQKEYPEISKFGAWLEARGNQ